MSGIHFKMHKNFEIDLSESLRFKIQIYGPFVCSAYRMDIDREENIRQREFKIIVRNTHQNRFNTLKGKNKT